VTHPGVSKRSSRTLGEQENFEMIWSAALCLQQFITNHVEHLVLCADSNFQTKWPVTYKMMYAFELPDGSIKVQTELTLFSLYIGCLWSSLCWSDQYYLEWGFSSYLVGNAEWADAVSTYAVTWSADVRLQSLVMWSVSPLLILLVMLLICLCFLCYRCFRRGQAKKRPIPCVHWFIYLLAFISW